MPPYNIVMVRLDLNLLAKVMSTCHLRRKYPLPNMSEGIFERDQVVS